MRHYATLLLLLAACTTDATEYANEGSAGGYALSETVDDEQDVVETFEELPPVDAPAEVSEDEGGPYTDDELAEMTTEELQDLYFADSGWSCCYSDTCRVLRDRCEDDEVMTTNGLGTACCSPSIGQCPENGWGEGGSDVDAG